MVISWNILIFGRIYLLRLEAPVPRGIGIFNKQERLLRIGAAAHRALVQNLPDRVGLESKSAKCPNHRRVRGLRTGWICNRETSPGTGEKFRRGLTDPNSRSGVIYLDRHPVFEDEQKLFRKAIFINKGFGLRVFFNKIRIIPMIFYFIGYCNSQRLGFYQLVSF